MIVTVRRNRMEQRVCEPITLLKVRVGYSFVTCDGFRGLTLSGRQHLTLIERRHYSRRTRRARPTPRSRRAFGPTEPMTTTPNAEAWHGQKRRRILPA
jgi:hypothetical protein